MGSTKIYNDVRQSCDFSAGDYNPLGNYPGSLFTNLEGGTYLKSLSGKCQSVNAAGSYSAYSFNTTDALPANCAVEATIAGGASLNYMAIIARIDPAHGNTHYFIRQHGETQLYRRVLGSNTKLQYDPTDTGYAATLYAQFTDEVGGSTRVAMLFWNTISPTRSRRW